MHVSMEQQQVRPPTPPNSDAAPTPHSSESAPATPPDSDILAAISNNSDEEEEIGMFDEESEEEGGAGSTNAEPTLGFPQVTFLDVQPVDPTLEGAFDFNTKVYKRRKLSVLGFDEKGTTPLLVRVVRCVAPGRDSPITSNETGTHITSTHQATGALGTGSV